MLTLERADRVWHVPKDSATFAFDLSTRRFSSMATASLPVPLVD